jgi:signal transduction histidine kinase
MTVQASAPSPSLGTRYARYLLVAMLVLLHIAALRGAQDFWARALMVAHIGLFMLWQPFMQGQQRLSPVQTLGVVLIATAILFWLNWWMLGVWVAVLAGVIGGKVFMFQARWLRIFYLLVLAYLVTLLLVWIVPSGLGMPVEPAINTLAQLGLPVIFLALLVLPLEDDSAEPQVVDLFYATLLAVMLAALVLGAFAYMTLGHVGYVLALTYSLLTLSSILLFLALAWNPRAGFAGLSMLFSRYLMSIGLPFEQWLHFLADLSRVESRPAEFLKAACEGLGRLPWVTGGEWTTSTGAGSFGHPSAHSVEFHGADFEIRLHSRQRPSPSLAWHFNLLGQLLEQFYTGKQREVKLAQQTYVQALHETGARMTHDVKNLLQSLNVLCSAATRENSDSPQLQALIRRHLPVVTQRLQLTLDKLQRPQMETGRFVLAGTWWEALQKSWQHRNVEFSAETIEPSVLLPKDLFDGTADNLLQNALEKRKLDPTVRVSATFAAGESVCFRVCDSGRAVPSHVVSGLLRGPVRSETGYGIALYQIARQAEMLGFGLALVHNESGRVCFELTGVIRPGVATGRGRVVAA